nr:hypothetical protein [Candidatus Njordarchaeum guaymaensis]
MTSKVDYFVVQIYLTGSRTILSVQTIRHTGTYASGIYFAGIVYLNLVAYTHGYVCKWTDLRNDGMQQSNEISVIASRI